jgi:Caspase domain
MTAAGPADTVAVVVGVEDYSDPEWAVPGPVASACAVASWLQACGVPPTQITLLVSPLVSPHPDVLRLRPGGHYRPATTEAVRHALTAELPRSTAGVLLMYWCGHGAEANDGQRLFFADSLITQTDQSVTALLRWLADEAIKPSEQCLIVDACRQHYDGLGVATVSQPFPVRRIGRHQQWVLQAAGIGELAGRNPADGTARFTTALLAELAVIPTEPWPPDLSKLADPIAARLEGQGPVTGTISHRDPQGGHGSVTFPPPVFLEEDAKNAVEEILRLLHAVRELDGNLEELRWELNLQLDYQFQVSQPPPLTRERIVYALEPLDGGWQALRAVCAKRRDIFRPRDRTVQRLIAVLGELIKGCGGDVR